MSSSLTSTKLTVQDIEATNLTVTNLESSTGSNTNKAMSQSAITTALSGKANTSEMAVSSSGDKTTITLKTGTSATVLNAHQSITGKADKVSGATTGDLAKLDSSGNLVDSGIDSTKVLTESDVKDNTTTQSATKPLSANMGYSLQQEINTLKARGRFLSLWNCITGLPVSFPLVTPYTYMTGDYFIVSNSASLIKDNTANYSTTSSYAVGAYTVYNDTLYKCKTAISGGEAWTSSHWTVVNDYIPTGSSYTGAASSVVATDEVFANDTYVYDGTYWLHQVNTGGKVAFANIAGQPKDNLALASELAYVVKHDSNLPGSTLPINASLLDGLSARHYTTTTTLANNIQSVNRNFAQIETSPSTHDYTVGEYLVYNGALCKVTSAIAINDSLIVGTNLELETVGDAIMNIIPTWNYLGSVSIKGPSLTVPASSIHVLCIIQDTYSEPRTASLDLYPGISKSGYYVVGAYYFNGAGLGSQIKWDGTNRQVSFTNHYTDAVMQDSGVTLYVYYR